MRIDNSPNIADNTMGTALTTAKLAENQDNKNTGAKNSEAGNGLTINGYELNLGEDLVEEKRKKAKSMAMQLMLDVYKTDKKLGQHQQRVVARGAERVAEFSQRERVVRFEPRLHPCVDRIQNAFFDAELWREQHKLAGR